jgi:hypothetical protein
MPAGRRNLWHSGGIADRVQVNATSTEDGWQGGAVLANQEVLIFDAAVPTGQSSYGGQNIEQSVIAPDGSYIGIDNVGLGLNILGHDCVVVGAYLLITGEP